MATRMEKRGGRAAARLCQALALLLVLAALALVLAARQGVFTRYTLTFTDLGETVSTQVLRPGETPQAAAPDMGGARVFLGWLDASGQPVDPALVPAQADAAYRTLWRPALTDAHVCYLWGEGGFLRPDEALRCGELAAALEALAAPGALAFYPDLPAGDGAVTAALLRETLPGFFDAGEVASALSGLADGGEVTRAQAAALLNALLGREAGSETLLPEEGAALFLDVPPARADYAELMEAAAPHSPDAAGAGWESAALARPYAPGFTLIDGALYHIMEDGWPLTDGALGEIAFGPDGKQTSGDAALDAYVRETIAAFGEGEREALLRAAYDYARDSFVYLRGNIYERGETGWETADALAMFQRGRGNCYSYAAVFWALARGLGYEAVAVSGTISDRYQPHAWVELERDGVVCICDPETEMVYRLEGEDDRDMFMMEPYKASQWTYHH